MENDIYPSHEFISSCTCGRENPEMIMNTHYFDRLGKFFNKYNLSNELREISSRNIVPDIDSLPICCKLRCCYGSVYSIPVELGSRTISGQEKKKISLLPGPHDSSGLFSWPGRKAFFEYVNGKVTLSQ